MYGKGDMQRVFHALNRGVDGRDIFMDNYDRETFLSMLFHFNSDKNIVMREMKPGGFENRRGEPLVSLLSFTQLDNHFHLAFCEEKQGFGSEYIRKLCIGYTKYFNLRHKRRGRIFESSTKIKDVINDTYLFHLIAYIHLNILDRISKDWRQGVVLYWNKYEEMMRTYPWSSARSYLNNSFHPALGKSKIVELLGEEGVRGHLDYLKQWSGREIHT